jgi:ABC-2 type transport system permease protein
MAKNKQTSQRGSRTIRVIAAALLVLVITFSTISICQNIGTRIKLDVTDQKLYTLSDGTKAILAKLYQPITMKLYYAKTATLKAPDQIKYFNNYYEFVKSLLQEYVAASKGMIKLQIIDPRPFSDDEVRAMRYGLNRFPITQDENFFFGLVVQTPFGVEKVIKFFSPDRQNFVEYDISYLIDTAITREKKKIGILSPLGVMGEDVSDYMAQLKQMQGQPAQPPWTFVEHLRRKYEVKSFPPDTNDINDIDILLVIHPKGLPEQTVFAIDQFILKGGRTIICVDPYCLKDAPDRTAMQTGASALQGSNLNALMRTWGLEMPENMIVGDTNLMLSAPVGPGGRYENVIAYLGLRPGCFNSNNVITAELNEVRFLFAGILKETEDPNQTEAENIERNVLVTTTNQGNIITISDPYELLFIEPAKLKSRFIPGFEPVPLAYLITGRFKSSFPDGIEIEVEQKTEDPNETRKVKKQITGLTQAETDCAVVVFADVDFISDPMAYRDFSIFGKVPWGDNSALMLNAIDDLTGSTDLISIRSRGNFRRPFTVVDEIEKQAEAETAQEVAKLNAQIAGFTSELQSILASGKQEETEVIGSTILQKQRDIELKKHEAQRQLNEIKLKKRERTEHLGNVLRNLNMLLAPAVILIIAIVLGIHRSARKRHYISHASDA